MSEITSEIKSVSIGDSFFSQKNDFYAFLEQFKNVFDCGGFVAGGLPLMYLYSDLDLWEILTSEAKLAPTRNDVLAKKIDAFCKEEGWDRSDLLQIRPMEHSLRGDLDIFFKSKEGSDEFYEKHVQREGGNKVLIRFSEGLHLEYFAQEPSPYAASFAETFKSIVKEERITEVLSIKNLLKSYISGVYKKKHVVQIVKSFLGQEEKIISNFDFVNSMIAFNDKSVYFHPEVETLLKAKVLKINKINQLNLSRISKYLAKYNLEKIEGAEEICRAVYEASFARRKNIKTGEEDKVPITTRLNYVLLQETILLSLLKNDTVTMLSSLLNSPEIMRKKIIVDGLYEKPFYERYQPGVMISD